MSNALEQTSYTEAFVSPQWHPGGKSFWYRRRINDGFEFILVDIIRRTIHPAFDHEQLAKELGKHASVKIDQRYLPFSWIEIEDGFVRFRFKTRIWQYDPSNHQLSAWDGVFTHGNPVLTSIHGSLRDQSYPPDRIDVRFTNNTRSPLEMYSTSQNGPPVLRTSIRQGEMSVRRVDVGSTWIFVGLRRLKGIYHVPDVVADTVVLEETNVDEYIGSVKAVLPPGWEERVTQADKMFYINHKSKSTTWYPPVGSLLKDPGGVQQTLHDPKVDKHSDTDVVDFKVTVDKYNVWLETTSKHKHQLSTNGTEDQPYNKNSIFHSHKKDLIVAWQSTVFPWNSLYNIKYTPDTQIRPELLNESIRLAGDLIQVERPRLFDIANKCEVPTVDTLFSNPRCIYNIGWNESGDEYYFLFIQRGHQCVRVIGIDRVGSTRIIIEETSQTFIDGFKLYYHRISHSDKMLWASERDGYNHLYLFDLKTGQLISQITRGPWNVRSVEFINEESEEIWASAYGYWKGQDPYHLHLIYVRFDGCDCKSLTKGDGNHRWSYPWSRGSQHYFVDTWSRVDLPPQTVVRSFDSPDFELDIQRPTAQHLLTLGWDPVERFVAPGRDGKTPIYGVIVRPPNFEDGKTFPVLECIYSGPQTFSVAKDFGFLHHMRGLAEEGYVVVQIDGMGTNWRSKAFHDVCHKNLKDAGFPDRILWIQEAAITRPWMDLSRVAIIGSSAGGQNAVSALLHYGDFYKVAVASSGCHDNRLNQITWGEQWMGYPVDESYIDNSNITHAAKLRNDAKLLLIAGGLDDVVNPASTMKLVTELNKQGKDYDFFFIPEGDHKCADNGVGYKRLVRFLREHLNP
ncbi:unnamed protein product [Clonostachys rhizophaga]|uniref:Probable dipeptidyl-aminopeptidase B n=1 Tax=Clonostachys rhizophaga TaxID=160324 RepID=A0A9N9YMT4_9HYPO|nr:unnamed protein product [Clonostachys rhizophaga]